MKRILVLCTLMIGLFALFASPNITIQPASAQAKSTAVTMDSCLATCRKCQKMCENTLSYCKKKGGKHAEAKHINTLKDCIQACKTSADYLSRNSQNHDKSCGFCAEICKICAKSCETMPEDKQMKACAAECRTCAESCEKMSNMMK